MALILIIDVCLPTGYVGIANENTILDFDTNTDQQQHAQWLHVAIDNLLNKNNVYTTDITHIAVTNGPGSYTGIRVGLSAAKGLAFALDIPVIVMSNLALIAFANKKKGYQMYIPMVDARRKEVFTGFYDEKIELIDTEFSHIIEVDSFERIFKKHKTMVCGSAAQKFEQIVPKATCDFCDKDYAFEDIYNYCILLRTKGVNITHNQLAANYIKPYYSTFNK